MGVVHPSATWGHNALTSASHSLFRWQTGAPFFIRFIFHKCKTKEKHSLRAPSDCCYFLQRVLFSPSVLPSISVKKVGRGQCVHPMTHSEVLGQWFTVQTYTSTKPVWLRKRKQREELYGMCWWHVKNACSIVIGSTAHGSRHPPGFVLIWICHALELLF